jgi:hypothetical protein
MQVDKGECPRQLCPCLAKGVPQRPNHAELTSTPLVSTLTDHDRSVRVWNRIEIRSGFCKLLTSIRPQILPDH